MKTTILVLTALLLFTLPSHAQLVLDLSDDNMIEQSIGLDTRPQVIIKNVLPDRALYKYEVNIESTQEDIPALQLPKVAGSCDSVEDFALAKRNLFRATDESDVPALVRKLKEQLKMPEMASFPECAETATELIALTEYSLPLNFALQNNQTIRVSVKRTMTDKDSSYTWVRIFTTPSKSPWSLMYGFTFIPNMMNPVAGYYSKADTSGKQFVVTQLNNDRKEFLKNISPTLMFVWKPVQKYSAKEAPCRSLLSNNFYQMGFVAGISLNFASETGMVNVMAGPSIVIADNIALSAGVALTQKSVLKGQYKEGDVLKEDLDFDQLHEKRYMGEWFLSLSFRFEQNPFKKTEEKE